MASNLKMKKMAWLVALLIFSGVSMVLAAVPTTINYQGHLNDNQGNPVPDGSYDMQFYLFDAETGENQLWNSPNGELQTVTVDNGVYNVQLGAIEPLDNTIFESGTAWLEIAIYNANTTNWEILSPRQLITATAYSLKAGDADTLGGAPASDFAADQHSHTGADITGGTIEASLIDDAIARDTELLWGNISGIPADISDGDDIGIATETDPTVALSVKDGVSWTELSGIPGDFADGVDNVGISSETDPQVGSNIINYVPKWNGSALASGTIFDNGNIGIGTAAPTDRLEVNGGNIAIDGLEGVAALRLRQNDTMVWTLFTAPWIDDNDLRIRNENGTGDVMVFDKESGNVGIGTTAPQSALNILGGAWDLFNTEGDFKIGGPTNRLKMGIARGGLGAGTANILAQGGVNTLNLGSGDNYVITIKDDKVGIGTSTLSEKLTVAGAISGKSDSAYGVYGESSNHTGVGVRGYASSSTAALNFGGYFEATGSSGRGVFGKASNTGSGVHFGGAFEASGENGIGVGGSASGISGMGVYGFATHTGLVTNYGGHFTAAGVSGRGVYGYASNEEYTNYGGYFEAAGLHGRGVVGISSGTDGMGVYGNGNGYSFYAGGSGTDYGPFTGAHEVRFALDHLWNLQPGMIVSTTGRVEIRKNENGDPSLSSTLPTVKLTTRAKDKAVLGVLVSEGSLPDDHWYKAQENERFGVVNALGEGRVWVTNVTGGIEAGDYITSSDIPGYGQLQDDDLVHSYTVGKAIETVNWNSVAETVEMDGEMYKAYLIAVVYTSG